MSAPSLPLLGRGSGGGGRTLGLLPTAHRYTGEKLLMRKSSKYRLPYSSPRDALGTAGLTVRW